MTPLRIAVVEQDGAGGLIHYAHQLCGALHDAGAEVTLFTGRHYELRDLPHRFEVRPVIPLWPAIEDPARTGGRVAMIGRRIRRAWRAVRYAWAWEVLTRRLIRHRPEVAILSIIRFPFQVFWLRRLSRRGIALAQICHEFEPRESRFGAVRRLTRRWNGEVFPLLRAIFHHGQANRDRFLGLFPQVAPDRLHLIPHGDEAMFLEPSHRDGDLRTRYGIPDGRPVALFFGGIRPSKGVEDLIDAFADVRREVDAGLLIIGHPAGVDPIALRARVEALGISSDVVIDPHYLPMDEVGRLMRTASVVVLPYRSATASGVLQVAYAFERPVVVTETGALPEAVEHGVTGLIVPPEDHDALVRAMVKLLDDPTEAAAMGRRAKQWADEAFGWTAIATTVLGVCRSIAREEQLS